ncbi:MAG: ankyrin repeat domain-containing protein, partial [Nitrospinota bacterium]|nr:ankyrin repeat domain-containing protein [Nitrospinota bacterium]
TPADLRLGKAVWRGDIEAIEAAIKAGADVNRRTHSNDTHLYSAVYLGNLETVGALLRHGADPQASVGKGFTPILKAAAQGNPLLVKLLLENGSNAYEESHFGDTTLMEAARGGDLEIIELFLSLGVDVNASDTFCWSALYHAAIAGNQILVRRLLARGADPNLKCDLDIDNFPLYVAVEQGHEEIVSTLLASGANPNRILSDGSSLLLIAIKWKHFRIAKILLERKTDVNVKNQRWRTALIWAYFHQHKGLISLLEARGAKMRLEDESILRHLMQERDQYSPSADGAMSIKAALESDEFVEISNVEGVVVDLKYASADNFMQENLYGGFSKALLRKEAAKKLAKAADHLRHWRPGYRLVVFDALRPRSVQRRIWARMNGTAKQGYVENPEKRSVHSYGMAVDLSILDKEGKPLDMGTAFDNFTPMARPMLNGKLYTTGLLTEKQLNNRQLLRFVMRSAEFTNDPYRWWHFDARPQHSRSVTIFKVVE